MTGNSLICVGAFAGAHGVRGDVRLKSFCANPADITGYGSLLSEDGARTFTIAISKPIKNGFAARVDGVATRDAAEALKGCRLYLPRDRLPPLTEDEYYHSDLIGLEAVDTGGTVLGKVAAVHDHGAGDMLELRGAGLGNGVLVPFTRAVVPTVDIGAGRVVVDPPAGLIE